MKKEKHFFDLQLFAENGTDSQSETLDVSENKENLVEDDNYMQTESQTSETVGEPTEENADKGVENDDVYEEDTENESRREVLRRRIGGWLKESRETSRLYPDFDLRNELKNNALFAQLVMGGAPVRAAYETVHRDEIFGGLMAYTADKVREQVVRDIETKGRRPLENGISSESAVVTAIDVNSLTSKDILKILKKVENGANIKF